MLINMYRVQRSLASKEEIVKDLRAKLETQIADREAGLKEGENEADGSDLMTLTMTQLRNR
jgi:hypothetical protein